MGNPRVTRWSQSVSVTVFLRALVCPLVLVRMFTLGASCMLVGVRMLMGVRVAVLRAVRVRVLVGVFVHMRVLVHGRSSYPRMEHISAPAH